MSHLSRDSEGLVIYDGKKIPPGPWHDEPDHLEFRSPDNLPCILHRNSQGAWCGYVGVAQGHPWHGVGCMDIIQQPDVHGGLTYAASCQGSICHVRQPGETDDVWWLGFDCNHDGDLSLSDIADARWIIECSSYRSMDYVKSETLSLARQAAEAGAERLP